METDFSREAAASSKMASEPGAEASMMLGGSPVFLSEHDHAGMEIAERFTKLQKYVGVKMPGTPGRRSILRA